MFSARKILFSMMAVFLMITVSSVGYAINTQTVEIEKSDLVSLGPSIIIPDDYPTIQEGIDNANQRDTIFVRSGVYNENILVETEGLTLIGENKYNTIISSRDSLKNTTKINALNVTIQGFSIVNATGSDALWDTSGVFVCSSNVVVKDNLIYGNRLGISALNIAYNLTICDNVFSDDGIIFGDYEHTPDNFDVTLECFLHNVYNNTVNGKPLYYFKNVNDFVVPDDAGQVILVNCTNVTIKNTYFTLCDFPIMLNYCNNCIVENNTVEDTYGEIITMRSENCTIQNNIVDNIIYGVCLDQKSKNNIVRYNKVTNSITGVVVMIGSSDNMIYGNNVTGNNWGIGLFLEANNNQIYKNLMEKNDIGLFLLEGPYENNIENNTFLKNLLQVQSVGKTKNYYNNNYWNRPRVIPKLIFGWLKGKQALPVFTVPYCITGVDWNPARQPIV